MSPLFSGVAMIAQIIINITAKRLQKAFTYIVPPEIEAQVKAGSRVLVPFGKRYEEGIVIAVGPEAGEETAYTLKPVLTVLSPQTGAQDEILDTALWISKYYLCNFADALRLFLIDKQGLAREYTLGLGKPDYAGTAEEEEILSYVRSHDDALEKNVYKRFAPDLVEGLLAQGVLVRYENLRNAVAAKTEKWLVFEHGDRDGVLMRKRKQAALLVLLAEKGEVPLRELMAEGFSRDTAKKLVNAGFAKWAEREKETTYVDVAKGKDTAWQLMPEQKRAVRRIQEGDQKKTWLLRGVTGSGKTEVYLRLAKDVIAAGKQVLILVPEIGLTGQIVRRFTARFGDDIVVMHSRLSKGERRNNCRRMAKGESHICIGARSAVFTAFADLGLVIVDEEHDGSYKQEEAPCYHAVNVARRRAAYYGCPVVLGSATPSVSDYKRALDGTYGLIELSRRVRNRPLPQIAIADMREELALGNYGVLSDKLADLLAETLRAGKQAIVLLNRRGFSTFVMCRKCGYVVKCDTCDVPMVYHKAADGLRCHYCDAVKEVPALCPNCGSKYIKFFGAGTEKVEAKLKELFPAARIVRLDQDTTKRKNSADVIIEAFRQHEFDILLGTQMVAKGHDFPGVAAVGILAADSLLNLPSYMAGERTFQLLTQAAGRAGRGDVPGRVVIQTYAPDHYVIAHSKAQDYAAFYEEEIKFRRELAYPPFKKLMKIMITDEVEQTLWQKGNHLYDLLCRHKDGCGDEALEIVGPYVDMIKKIRNRYRIAILLRHTDLSAVKLYIRREAAFWQRGILIDVDPAF